MCELGFRLNMFFCQFGLCSPNISNPNTQNSLECNSVLEMAEQLFQSWTFWDTSEGFTFWDEVKDLQGLKAKFLNYFFVNIRFNQPIKIQVQFNIRQSCVSKGFQV
jgi:hypothetical protein